MIREHIYKREGTAIVGVDDDSVLYEADCFVSKAEAARAVTILNVLPDLDWDELAAFMGIEPDNQEPRHAD